MNKSSKQSFADTDQSCLQQAEQAINQGQSVNDFVANTHPDNRVKARKAWHQIKNKKFTDLPQK